MDIIPEHALKKIMRKFGSQEGVPNALIYFGRLCSCVGKAAGNYDPTCPYCVFGFIYEPDPVEELVLRTAVNLKFMTEQKASIYEGGCRITIPKYQYDGTTLTEAYKRVAQGDVIVMKGDTHRERDICERGKKDYLYAFGVTKVLSISELDYVFTEGIHYTVNYDNIRTTIEWIEDPTLKGQLPLKYYSVEYESKLNYMVWEDQPKPRGALDNNSPKMVMCRLRPYFDPFANNATAVDTNYQDNQIEGEQSNTIQIQGGFDAKQN